MARSFTLNRQQWRNLETILLDMDGTLLDLNFDNHFWLEIIPKEYALKHQLSSKQANDFLQQHYQKHHGTLNWYCTDFWSEKLALDIVAIKQRVAEKVDYRPGTLSFLKMAKAAGKKLYLATNAHPDTLAIKLEQKDFSVFFDGLITSHQTGKPKESLQFWQTIQQRWNFDKDQTLFVDDSEAILATAKEFGIGYLCQVSQPDLSKADLLQEETSQPSEFAMINHLNEIIPN